jgi:hypothetical protein
VYGFRSRRLADLKHQIPTAQISQRIDALRAGLAPTGTSLTSFGNFGLAEPIMRALIEEKYETPTPTPYARWSRDIAARGINVDSNGAPREAHPASHIKVARRG